MGEKIRAGENLEIEAKDPDERYGNAPETHIWQAHVHEEEAKHQTHFDTPVSVIHHYAEEYAQRAMRGVEVTSNEYQAAEQLGEKHLTGGVPEEVADAGDIAGG